MANQAGGAPNMYGNMAAPILPSAGQYSDMQTLMQNMENLSGWLEQNRQEWAQVQEGLAKVERLQAQGRLSRDATLQSLTNGEHPPTTSSPDPTQPTTSQLQTALSSTQSRLASLERNYRDQQTIQTAYDDALTDATERIRHFCFEQQRHVAALHTHYTTLLASSRAETLDAQLTHQAWQAGLQRVSENVRMALRAREDEKGGMAMRRKLAALREENRVLRLKVGWSVAESESESSDEEREDVSDGRMV